MAPKYLLPEPETLLAHDAFLHGLATRLLGDPAEAEDVVQGAYVRALETRPRGRASLRSWLATVAERLALESLRRSARRRSREQRVSRSERAPSASEMLHRERVREDVARAVLALREPSRTVVLLRFYEDLPVRKIAARLDVPVETVRTRLKRGMERLRAQLRCHAGEPRRAALLVLIAPLGQVRGARRSAGLLTAAGLTLALTGLGLALPAGLAEAPQGRLDVKPLRVVTTLATANGSGAETPPRIERRADGRPVLTSLPERLEEELKHDDGTQEGRRSMQGGGHAVHFERPGAECIVTAVRVHGSRYGRGYDPYLAVARVSLCDEAMKPFATRFLAYDAFTVGKAQWADVEFAPTRVPERFFALVEFFPARTRGIYMSIDEGNSGHSYGAVQGRKGAALEKGEWMIRVQYTKRVPKVELPDPENVTVLERGSGESLGKRSMAGSGHATLFKATRSQQLVKVSVFGGRYGTGYRPEATFFHVFVCDKKMKPLARSAHPYSLFAAGEPGWVDIEMPPCKVPRDFAVLVVFAPTQSRGVYVHQWEEKKRASLNALPGKVQGKADGGGWMIRAHVADSLKKQPLPKFVRASPRDLDALEIVELLEGLERAEREERVLEARRIVNALKAGAPEHEASRLAFQASPHFFLRSRGLEAKASGKVLRLLEAAHGALGKRFGFEEVSAYPGKRIHVHVLLGEGTRSALFTNPRAAHYSHIVLRGDESVLRGPGEGGKHIVYGLCHELGHVLIGWQDSRHQWAHYVGSRVASDVYGELGAAGWIHPYDYHVVDGWPRFLTETRDQVPGLSTDARMARLFQEVGERYGERVYAKALQRVKETCDGQPFHAVRLYALADLKNALAQLSGDPDGVERLFVRE